MSECSPSSLAPASPRAQTASSQPLVARHAPAALVAAASLGLAGDLLLRPVPWGLNLLLWTMALAAVAHRVDRRAGAGGATRHWAPIVILAAACMAWRDSPVLKALDLVVIGLVLALAAWHVRGGAVRRAGVSEQLLALLHALFDAWTGTLLLVFQDIRWGDLPRGAATRHAGGLLRGLAIGLPLAALFGRPLGSADARFERWLRALFQWDVGAMATHLLVAAAFAWIAGSILRALPLRGAAVPVEAPRLPGPRLGVLEVAIVLGMLNALFLAFVVMQVPYLFGGSTLIEGGTLNYSEYARRGFFELVWVAGLVLPVLLGLHWFMRAERPTHTHLFRGFAWMQVLLVMVIVASGLHRMRLYQAAYGLTELRLYTTAFMGWIAVVLAWFCMTVLQGRRDRFAFGALLAGGAAVAALHVANPDAWIVRTNLERAREGRRFDAGYAASLSGDAVPVLVAGLPALPEKERCAAAGALERRWGGPGDWRAWSWGRSRAHAAVSRAVPAAGCPPPERAAAREGGKRTPAAPRVGYGTTR